MADVALSPFSFKFISDGVSTAFTRDLTVQPVSANFAGTPPLGLLNVTVTNAQGATVPGFTSVMSGMALILTFAAPLPQFDDNSLIVIYTVSFFVQS